MKIIRILFLIIGSFTIVLAQNPNLGTAGAQFLQIGVGARAMAMAGATVASSNDASAIFSNPAGIASVFSQSTTFNYIQWWATIQITAAAYAVRLGDAGTVGASVVSMSMDPMEVTTELYPEGTGQTFSPSSTAIGLTYARPLTDKFNAGITVKYVNETILRESSSGVAFDVGTQYRLWFNDLTIGMSLTNFGGNLKMDGQDLSVTYDKDVYNTRERKVTAKLLTDEYALPLHFQVGVSLFPYKSENVSWLVAFDVAHPNDNDERINVGTEISIFRTLFLRGGYRSHYDEEGLTLGAGIAWSGELTRITFDYGFSQYNSLPSTHRFSIGLDF
jgi:hypothetical protein